MPLFCMSQSSYKLFTNFNIYTVLNTLIGRHESSNKYRSKSYKSTFWYIDKNSVGGKKKQRSKQYEYLNIIQQHVSQSLN